MTVIKQPHLWQDWLSCNTVLPVEKSKLFVLHLSKSELCKVTQLAGFKLLGMCAHLASQLWHRVLCFFGAMPNTLLPNNLPDHQNSKRFLSSFPQNEIAVVEIQHMTSAVQVLVIEKELTGCDLKMAAAPKSIILISAEIVLFFPSGIKRQNGFKNQLWTLPSLHLVSYYGLKSISSSNHHFIHLVFAGPLLPPTVKASRLSFIVLPVVQASMHRYKSSSVLIDS